MVRMASQRRVEAPPGFEPGWRFRRAIPGGFPSITSSHDRARTRGRSTGCADRLAPSIVRGVG